MSEVNETNTTAAEAPAPAPALTPDLQALVDFIDGEVKTINGLPKKSNYHNARRSAYITIRNLIIPPPPKPEKVKPAKADKPAKKTKEEKAAEKATPAQPAAATPEVEGESVVVPFEEGA